MLNSCTAAVAYNTLQDAPVSLDGLQLLLSRESAKEPPQTYLISFAGADAASSSERRITDFPHPYPQVRCS
jgi:dipeptidyl aminopeptidase/acylaminoacyl peptidase